MDAMRRRKADGRLRRRYVLTLGLLACVSSALYWRTAMTDGDDGTGSAIHHPSPHHMQWPHGDSSSVESEFIFRRLDSGDDDTDFTLCGRATRHPPKISPALEHRYQNQNAGHWCSHEFDPNTPTLVLEGYDTYGRTGNHLRTLFQAFQLVRDANYQLAIMYNSWAMGVIVQSFFATSNHYTGNRVTDHNWVIARIERELCVKIVHDTEELRGWRIVLKSPHDVFRYRSPAPPEEQMVGQLRTLRTLFRNINTGGEGTNQFGDRVKDMCSGINYLFGEERIMANYTVIHLRYMEGPPGVRILGQRSRSTGCDPTAALEMKPDYIKSILKPLGMMDRPIVVITDGQNGDTLSRLMADEEIGPMMHVLAGDGAAWFGGDVTLAVMANVFVGNPASTMSSFIAKARIALGFEGSSHLFRARDDGGEWRTVCGDDCVFDIGLPKNDTAAAAATTRNTTAEAAFGSKFSVKLARAGTRRGGRITINQLSRQQESRVATNELREMARGSKVYTGLHPGDLAKRYHAPTVAQHNAEPPLPRPTRIGGGWAR